MKKMAALLVALLIPVLLLCGCQKRQLDEAGKASTNCANITMGMGSFASRDGYIYIVDFGMIHEYDTLGGKTVDLAVDKGARCGHINVTADYIYFTDFTGTVLYRFNREGKEREVLKEDGAQDFYIDGERCYYVDENEKLYNSDLAFEDAQLIAEDVFQYYVEGSDIYIIKNINDVLSLYKTDKDLVQPEQIPLSFEPTNVYCYDGAVYMSTTLMTEEPFSYQIIRYCDGEETPLPIYSLSYQILDGHLIYVDNLTDILKSYDLATGEIEEIQENVMHFGILEDRYICTWCMGSESVSSSSWMLYDWQTGETKQMHP